ncbi:MAG: 1-aminocyclopropane-1-carboxylate deaminase/D-cysteine desulfhydrase [Chitinophagaceae bacterium]
MENKARLDWLDSLAEKNIITQNVDLEICSKMDMTWDILRTDLIHPVCSGNKFFKLKYYLTEALKKNKKTIVTYGGPWSNHLVATAFAAHSCGLNSIGYVRGEEPELYSPTLLECMKLGMKLIFLNREHYDAIKYSQENTDDALYIPQGGYGLNGMIGASEILNYTNKNSYSHIISAVGSGTMFAGLYLSGLYESATVETKMQINVTDDSYRNPIPLRNHDFQLIGVTVHRDQEIKNEIEALLSLRNLKLHQDIQLYEDEMGGFAKFNKEVIAFMNSFYQKTMIPTDFVYTGRLMKWIYEAIAAGKFPKGSKILAIHSGGLQGNISLKPKSLLF